MANRTVAVALKAEIGQYVAGMSKASAATMRVGESARSSQAQASKHFDLAGKGALIMGGAIVAGLGMAVSKSMDFEKSMSAVSAATQASAGTLGQLRDAAMKAGADTKYSATEAADGITEMAKAGVSAKDIMGGGLTGALSLAAAGQIDVAEAAGLASTAMTQFSLSGKDLPHVADLLAAGAGKAMGSVDDLGQALNQAGLVASASGMSIEETTGTLAAFASAGLLGSDAGTSMKTMLQKLQAPSKEAAGVMSELGINMYDANGNMLGMAEMAGQLKDHMGGLTQEQRNSALATIFGSDAVRAANVLYKEGAQGITDWTGKVNDAGYATKTAAQLQDNLAGDLEKLGGSFDTLMINLGSGTQGPLRELVQMLGGVVDGVSGTISVFGDLPGPVQAAVVAMGLWAVAGDRVVSAYGGARDKMAAFREEAALQQALFAQQSTSISDADRALGGLGTSLETTGSRFGTARAAAGAFARAIGPELGVAAGVWVLAEFVKGLQSISGASAAAESAQQGFLDVLRQTNGVMDDTSRKGAQHALVQADLVHILGEAGVSSKDAIDGLLGVEGAQDRVTRALQDYITANPGGAHNKNAEAARVARNDYLALAESLGMSKEESEFFADAALGAADATTAAGAAAAATVPQVDEATKAQEKWIEQLQQLGSSFVEPVSIYTGLLQQAAQATADATESSKDSWQDYADSSSVSLDQFAQKLQDQIVAQENWRTNLVTISQRGGEEVAQILADMGVEGAGLVQQMVDANGEDFGRMRDLMIRDAQLGGSGAASELNTAMKVMAAVGAQGAGATVVGIATQLGLGVGQVAEIARQYGVTLASGVNPVLDALGRPVIHVAGRTSGPAAGPGGTQVSYSADGNLFENHSAQIASAGAMRVWAEPETGGEAYIPLASSKRSRSMNIWRETGKRLGAPEAQFFARGGFASASAVPRPSSTSPYRAPLSTAGDAAMAKEYNEVTAWLNANVAPMGGGGPAGAGVQRWLPLVLASLNMVGQPASLAQTVLRRMQQESGGNARAINLTDINARRGTPSKGLMQVIDPTFRAYAMPGHSSDIWDPLSNLLASERYAMARYGSLSAAYNKAGGYANGGTTPVGDPFWVGENGPELMWSSREKYVSSAARSREFSGGEGGGGTVVKVAAPDLSGLRIAGTLDLGGGLEARIDGRIINALTAATDRGRYNG